MKKSKGTAAIGISNYEIIDENINLFLIATKM